MLKLVLNDYKLQWKSALKNLYSSSVWFIYWMIFPPLWGTFKETSYPIYYGAIIPLFAGFAISRMYPNRLSKTLLLTPLTDTEKRDYLVTAFRLRTALPMLLFLITGGLLVGIGLLAPIFYLITAVFQFPFYVSANICCPPQNKTIHTAQRGYPLSGHYELWSALNALVGIFSNIVLYDIIDDSGTELSFPHSVILAVLFLMELAVFLKLFITYYKPVMECAVRYENYN